MSSPATSGQPFVQTSWQPASADLPREIEPERMDDKLTLESVRARFLHIHGHPPVNWSLTEASFVWAFKVMWSLKRSLASLGCACYTHAQNDVTLAKEYNRARMLLDSIDPSNIPDWGQDEEPPTDNASVPNNPKPFNPEAKVAGFISEGSGA